MSGAQPQRIIRLEYQAASSVDSSGDHWVIGGIGSPWLSASVALVGIVAEVLRAIGRTSTVTFVGHRVFALCLAEYRP